MNIERFAQGASMAANPPRRTPMPSQTAVPLPMGARPARASTPRRPGLPVAGRLTRDRTRIRSPEAPRVLTAFPGPRRLFSLFQKYCRSNRITIGQVNVIARAPNWFAYMKSQFWTPVLVCTVVWQLCALAMVYSVGGLIFVWIFELLFVRIVGPIQANYASFARFSLYFGYFLVTAPATYLCVRLFDRMRKVSLPRKTGLCAWLGWTWLVWSALVFASTFGISYQINQLFWALFGVPNDLYSFRNIMLHRIVTWFLCTIPTSIVALRVYTKLTTPRISGFPIETMKSN